MEKLKLMIADDSKEQVQTLTTFFNNEDSLEVVATYGDGAQLLSALRSLQTDVLILDIFMPKCDGIKVLEELNNNKASYKVPKNIIVITAFSNDRVMQKCSQYHADYFMIKPVNLNYLLDVIFEIRNQRITEPQVVPSQALNFKSCPYSWISIYSRSNSPRL